MEGRVPIHPHQGLRAWEQDRRGGSKGWLRDDGIQGFEGVTKDEASTAAAFLHGSTNSQATRRGSADLQHSPTLKPACTQARPAARGAVPGSMMPWVCSELCA